MVFENVGEGVSIEKMFFREWNPLTSPIQIGKTIHRGHEMIFRFGIVAAFITKQINLIIKLTFRLDGVLD